MNENCSDPTNLFATLHQKLGFSVEEDTHDIAAFKNRPLTFSGDALTSDVPPKLILIQSIAKLKEIIGKPDSNQNEDIEYPPAALDVAHTKLKEGESKAAFIESLSDTTKENIGKAYYAYLYGDSKRVAAYEPLLDATLLPQTIAYFGSASEDWVINKPITLSGPNPIVCNYHTITFEPGGTLTVDNTVPSISITCNKMNKIAT